MAIIGPPMTFLEASVIENVKSLLKPSGKAFYVVRFEVLLITIVIK